MPRMDERAIDWVEEFWRADFTNPHVRDQLGYMLDEMETLPDGELPQMIDRYNELREESMAQINEQIYGCLDYC